MSTLHIETTKPLTAFFACTREGQKVTSPKLSELANTTLKVNKNKLKQKSLSRD